VLLLLCAPLLLACALLILLTDGPPVLFRQERIGLGARPFRIVKFRTMRAGVGPLVTSAGDARVTPIGRLLRRAKLDELPQLGNVLAGSMTLVGPRPEVPAYVAAHRRLFAGIADLKPGLTDWASLAFRDEEALLAAHAGEPDFYVAVLLPRKVALARLYRRARSRLLDLRLLAATALLAVGAEDGMRRLAGVKLLARARRGTDAAADS
jgi:lipopolysaccharide/colanic/teichoic acid biosynthesis glycosyltransferase